MNFIAGMTDSYATEMAREIRTLQPGLIPTCSEAVHAASGSRRAAARRPRTPGRGPGWYIFSSSSRMRLVISLGERSSRLVARALLLAALAARLALAAACAGHHGAFEDVADILLDPLGHDAIGLVEGQLLVAPPLGLADGALHRAGHVVGIEDRLAVEVARGAADGLDQRALAAQEAFLVRIEDRHQRHLGHVQAFAQQVDAHQHVERAPARRSRMISTRSTVSMSECR